MVRTRSPKSRILSSTTALFGASAMLVACSAPDTATLGNPVGYQGGSTPVSSASASNDTSSSLMEVTETPITPGTTLVDAEPVPTPVSEPEPEPMQPTDVSETPQAPTNGAGLGLNQPDPEPEPPAAPIVDEVNREPETSEPEPVTEPEPEMDDGFGMGGFGQGGGGFGDTGGDTGADTGTETDPGTDPDPEPETGPGPDPETEPAPGTTPGGAGECIALAVGDASGDVGTEAACFVVTGEILGWQVSNLGERSLTVNGEAVEAPALPAAAGGEYVFEFSAGEPSYTAFSTW